MRKVFVFLFVTVTTAVSLLSGALIQDNNTSRSHRKTYKTTKRKRSKEYEKALVLELIIENIGILCKLLVPINNMCSRFSENRKLEDPVYIDYVGKYRVALTRVELAGIIRGLEDRVKELKLDYKQLRFLTRLPIAKSQLKYEDETILRSLKEPLQNRCREFIYDGYQLCTIF